MHINPDTLIAFHIGAIPLPATIVSTWIVMALLVAAAWFFGRRLTVENEIGTARHVLEVIVSTIEQQVQDVGGQRTRAVLPFVGTLFLFIALSNLLIIVPGFMPPTGSLSTTTALAIAVLIAVPVFGVATRGLGAYLRRYLSPTPLMLPFNIIGEVSRTIALAVRLYGNVMSGMVIGAILITIAPFVFPVIMQLLGLLTGLIQAYIFAVLALVYIASATAETATPSSSQANGDSHG